MKDTQIEAIERDITNAQECISLGNKLARLKTNVDFKAIVLERYFMQEAIRLVHLKADPGMQSADAQRSILNQMDAIGAFSSYLDLIFSRADMAVRTKDSAEIALNGIYDVTGEF